MMEYKKRIYHLIIGFFQKFSRGNFGTKEWKNRFQLYGHDSEINYPASISGLKGISLGNETKILRFSRIQNFYQDGNSPEIIIGDRCFIGLYFSILNASKVKIGNDVLIASHVLISSENHGINPESELPYMSQPLSSKPVIINDGCWIGEKVVILPGVTIGEKSIIAAGSIVTKSIPAFSIAAGNPAKVIKKYNFESHKWEKVDDSIIS